jgi:DNA primase catalytic core
MWNQFIEQCNNILLNLYESQSDEWSYLYKIRNITLETVKKYNIGFCPVDFKIPEWLKYFSDKRKEWDLSYNIHGKIIVPVYDEFSNPVGLATRKADTSPESKWWNLPSPFKKGNHLYLLNLNRRKIFDENKIYIVEGYMDALQLAQNGLYNVAGLMGTAYTLRKLALTCRYCNNVCLCYDSDKSHAGDIGKNKSISLLSQYNFCDNISVIDGLPISDDPSSYVIKYGIDQFLSKERVLSQKEIDLIASKHAKRK